jgi:hypothetical protein
MNEDEKLKELLEYCTKPHEDTPFKIEEMMFHPIVLERIRKAMELPKIEPPPFKLIPTDHMEIYWRVFEPSMLSIIDKEWLL